MGCGRRGGIQEGGDGGRVVKKVGVTGSVRGAKMVVGGQNGTRYSMKGGGVGGTAAAAREGYSGLPRRVFAEGWGEEEGGR